MSAYIVEVAQIKLGDKVFKKGEAVDLSADLAAKLFSKGYITFDRPVKKTSVLVNEEFEITSNQTEEKSEQEEKPKKGKTKSAESEENQVVKVDTNFNPDEMIVK